MCGIAGRYGQPSESAAELVSGMVRSLEHRGPDDTGLEVLADGRVVLGHRRLSILDLSPLGHQPMRAEDGQTWIVFNGEIYNFREIRSELESKGHSFRTESDTEVILVAYREWGLKEAVIRFHGMFAFAIWDGATRALHLCRDRFGVKPLYFVKSGEGVAFASELRALNLAGLTSREVDARSVAHFIQYGYFSMGTSVFTDVSSVRPGTIVSIQENFEAREVQYWSTEDLFESAEAHELRRELDSLAEEELLDRVEDALIRAFRYRMVADVPVGLFLSGGIDSSLVATILARRAGVSLRTFTIGYGDSEFDEMPYAREVAAHLDAEHTEQVLSGSDALEIVERLPQLADEPIGDSSMIPTFLVSRLAREHVTVALSADGGDELFGGYARYGVCGRFVRRSSLPLRAMYGLSSAAIETLPPALVAAAYGWTRGRRDAYAGINDKLRKFARMARSDGSFAAYDAAVSEWTSGDVARLLGPAAAENRSGNAKSTFDAVRNGVPEDQFMHFDMARYLPGDLLTKVDRASMSVSLEAREPLLDHELAKIAAALPLRWKIRQGKSKYILRRILERHLPGRIFDRPKKGFSIPVGQWFRGPLRELLRDELSESRVKDVGLLDPRAVREAVEDFFGDGRRTSPAGIWHLLQLQQWAARWTMPATPGPELGA